VPARFRRDPIEDGAALLRRKFEAACGEELRRANLLRPSIGEQTGSHPIRRSDGESAGTQAEDALTMKNIYLENLK